MSASVVRTEFESVCDHQRILMLLAMKCFPCMQFLMQSAHLQSVIYLSSSFITSAPTSCQPHGVRQAALCQGTNEYGRLRLPSLPATAAAPACMSARGSRGSRAATAVALRFLASPAGGPTLGLLATKNASSRPWSAAKGASTVAAASTCRASFAPSNTCGEGHLHRPRAYAAERLKLCTSG